MTETAEFWNNAAEKYATDPIKDQASYDHTLDRVRSYLRTEDSVLEVGCGTGSTALLLAGGVAEYTATDFSSEMIRIARGKLADAGPQTLSFEVQEAGWVAPGKTYDAILGFNLFHLVRDVEGAVASLSKALKPGGVMITKTVCLRGNPIYPVMIGAMRLVGKAPYVRMFSPAQLDALFEAAGFDVIETGQFPKRPPSHFVVARKR
ncbi:MAG: class I SAM-dependent methyltransferase [Rhodobacteraceae bacterium]|nr:class I SAM-dependent methyltransferase [Paracoccaceae bacterium]